MIHYGIKDLYSLFIKLICIFNIFVLINLEQMIK